VQSTWSVISFPAFTFVYDYARLYVICGIFTTLKFIFRKGIVKDVIVYSSVGSTTLAQQGFQSCFEFCITKNMTV